MELKDQVCSLELAKRLKELGVKQESLWWWHWRKKEYTYSQLTYQEDVEWELFIGDERRLSGKENTYLDVVSAFTVAELGEMLPWGVEVGTTWYELTISKNGTKNSFCAYYQSYKLNGAEDDVLNDVIYREPKEADCRAKMLIYLLEHDLITI